MISSNPKLGHWNEFQNYHRHLFKIKIKNREFIETDIILFPVWKQCPSWKDQSLDWEIKKISIVYQALQWNHYIFWCFHLRGFHVYPSTTNLHQEQIILKKTVIYESSK